MLFKNIELKGIKTFVDHEGCYCHSGNIYLNKKKVGHFEDDFMCGPMHFDFVSKDVEKELNEASVDALKKYGFMDENDGNVSFLFKDKPIEGVIAYINELLLWSKEIKKLQKKYPQIPCGYLLAYKKKEYMYNENCGSYHHELQETAYSVRLDRAESVQNAKEKLGEADLYVVITDKELIPA